MLPRLESLSKQSLSHEAPRSNGVHCGSHGFPIGLLEEIGARCGSQVHHGVGRLSNVRKRRGAHGGHAGLSLGTQWGGTLVVHTI